MEINVFNLKKFFNNFLNITQKMRLKNKLHLSSRN